jgi:hypothetical protein
MKESGMPKRTPGGNKIFPTRVRAELQGIK